MFFTCGSAAGTGGTTDGGVAVLFAVPWRMDKYAFFVELRSTSPNFCASVSQICLPLMPLSSESPRTFCETNLEAEAGTAGREDTAAGSSCS